MTQTEDFLFSKLTERYGIVRSQVYARINALKAQNPELSQFTSRGKSWVNPAVLGCLDEMDRLVGEGYTTDQSSEIVANKVSTTVEPNTDQTVSTEQSAIVSSVSGGAIATNEKPIVSAIKTASTAEPFAKYKMLDEVSTSGWHLPSSEIAAILGRKSLTGQEFELYGFRFTRQGKAGSESTWKVEKLE